LPVALAKVRSQSDLPTFAIVHCRPAVCGVHVLRPGKPPERWSRACEAVSEAV